jgi:hypothetical protein
VNHSLVDALQAVLRHECREPGRVVRPVNRVHPVARPKVAATNCCVFLARLGTKSGTPNWLSCPTWRTRTRGDTFGACGPFPLFFNFFRTGSDPSPSQGTGTQVTGCATNRALSLSRLRSPWFVATVALLGASQAPCVRSLHLLHSPRADNKCRHTGLSRKCLRTKARLAEFPLGSPLHF